MAISLSLIMGMAGVSVGGVILEKILGGLGKVEAAQMVSVVTTSMLASTVVTAVAKVFVDVAKLGN